MLSEDDAKCGRWPSWSFEATEPAPCTSGLEIILESTREFCLNRRDEAFAADNTTAAGEINCRELNELASCERCEFARLSQLMSRIAAAAAELRIDTGERKE